MFSRILLTAALIVAALPSPSFAFYKSENEKIEARGLARLLNWFTENPDAKFLYPNETDQGAAGFLRLMADARPADGVSAELNAYQIVNISTSAAPARSWLPARDVERSSALEWRQRGETGIEAVMALDRANLRLTSGRIDAIIGRQAINLATCYYFTPNDFFAPFAAQTFYRLYKPGVDAARIETRFGPLTQLTLIGALGYRADSGASNGWSGEADFDRTSYIARLSTAFLDIDWAILGGKAGEDDVIGAAVQGDLFWKIGLRAEGHYRTLDNADDITEISAQLERRFENSLTIRLEGFYHGAGAETAYEYNPQAAGLYLGRWYSAAGVSYEFTPLFTGEALAVTNHTDGSRLLSVYSVYSVSDEAELSVGFYVPFGETPKLFETTSEFGSYPSSFTVEIRSAF